MDITCERDARTWVAYWFAERGHIPKGILAATIDGLACSLSIMEADPSRYTAHQREDLREALSRLQRERND